MAKVVKIRFLGDKFQKGIPKERFIDIGRQRLWNHPRFKEQMDDGSYIRPFEFYEKHKDILKNKKLFIIEFVSELSGALSLSGDIKEPISILTPSLKKAGVKETEGILECPECDFIADKVIQMEIHLTEHGA